MTLQTELLYAQLTYADRALPALNSAVTQNMGVSVALVTYWLDEAEIQHCICSCRTPVFALNCLQNSNTSILYPILHYDVIKKVTFNRIPKTDKRRMPIWGTRCSCFGEGIQS